MFKARVGPVEYLEFTVLCDVTSLPRHDVSKYRNIRINCLWNPTHYDLSCLWGKFECVSPFWKTCHTKMIHWRIIISLWLVTLIWYFSNMVNVDRNTSTIILFYSMQRNMWIASTFATIGLTNSQLRTVSRTKQPPVYYAVLVWPNIWIMRSIATLLRLHGSWICIFALNAKVIDELWPRTGSYILEGWETPKR
jgi:hypothetical protein